MPSVRSIRFTSSLIEIIDHKGTKQLVASAIPPTNNTIAKIENFINNTWIPANITDYQARVHVFSITPFSATVGTWNLGEIIPANWWEDS